MQFNLWNDVIIKNFLSIRKISDVIQTTYSDVTFRWNYDRILYNADDDDDDQICTSSAIYFFFGLLDFESLAQEKWLHVPTAHEKEYNTLYASTVWWIGQQLKAFHKD